MTGSDYPNDGSRDQRSPRGDPRAGEKTAIILGLAVVVLLALGAMIWMSYDDTPDRRVQNDQAPRVEQSATPPANQAQPQPNTQSKQPDNQPAPQP